MQNSGTEKKSPIREKHLRRPGQSLVEILSDIQLGQMMLYVLIIGISGSFLIFIWFNYIFPSSPHPPYGISIVLAGAFAFSLYKLNRFKKEIDNLRLGIDGELAVAESLDELKSDGALVFHDLIGNGFNIDHVVLSTKGIFVVETKTWRKRSSDKLIYDGINLKLGENNLPNNSIKQVASEAHWLSRKLEKSTKRRYELRPVLVFPGWFVEGVGTARESEIWVLNPEALVKIIRREPDVLTEKDVKDAAFILSTMNR